ncbi:MAG: hypothetical protein DMF62_02310 [Acidobacteria bacterium]|nr:MAG: hypothetical protein DMF62_02310 [Acidobacteriota bacterium]
MKKSPEIRIRKYAINVEIWESDYPEAGYRSRREFEDDFDKRIHRMMDRLKVGASWTVRSARSFYYLGGKP